MKKLYTLALCFLALALPACTPSESAQDVGKEGILELSRDGQTTCVIVVADDAIPAEKMAATQLQKYLNLVTTATFVIKEEGEVNAESPQILVGAGTRAKQLLPKQDWQKLGQDGIVIKTAGNKLILAGGRPRGTLYAVFQFLEDNLGCRWWTPTETTIPQKKNITLEALNVEYVPPFAYREHFTTTVRADPVFATAMRENGHFLKQDKNWGGHYEILGWCHTFSQLLPPEKYFKDHPSWYSDPLNNYLPCKAGSRMPHGGETQLCLSNAEVVDEISKNAVEWIRKNPNAGYISISHNDAANSFCRCPACMKTLREEGGEAGPLVKFVNAVAAKIGEEYPDFLVETLAYQRTEKPPKTIRPAGNVLIRFAPIEADFGSPLDSETNRTVNENLKGWAAISKNLFVWNYVTNFQSYYLPHPNWPGLGRDLRLFAANNVQGVFEQGDPYTKGVGDFVQLRAWLMSKLMWNPQLDQSQLTNEFLNGYYGQAGPFLLQYLDLIQTSFQKQKRPLSQTNQDYSFLTLDVMNEATRLFDAAEKAVAGDKELLARVQRQRLSLTIAWIFRYQKLKPEADKNKLAFLGPQDPVAALREFVQSAERFGDNNFSKGGAFPTVVPRLEGLFAPRAELPDFAQNLPADDVIDFQQKDFYLYRKGELSNITDDTAASDGKAATMIGNIGDWAAQAPLSWVFEGANKSKWHVYAAVRVGTKENAEINGNGVTLGIYDNGPRKAVMQQVIPLEKLAGEKYHLLDLGSYDLNGQMYVWFSPGLNVVVDKVYIDRVLLVRDK